MAVGGGGAPADVNVIFPASSGVVAGAGGNSQLDGWVGAYGGGGASVGSGFVGVGGGGGTYYAGTGYYAGGGGGGGGAPYQGGGGGGGAAGYYGGGAPGGGGAVAGGDGGASGGGAGGGNGGNNGVGANGINGYSGGEYGSSVGGGGGGGGASSWVAGYGMAYGGHGGFYGGGGGGGSYLQSQYANASGGWGRQGIVIFMYTPLTAPVVSSCSPNAGPTAGGQAVAIGGSGFYNIASVNIGGAPLTGISYNAGAIYGTTSAGGAGTYNINVIVTGGVGQGTGGSLYTYVNPPSVSGCNPARGLTLGGTAITVSGANFAGTSSVIIGGVAATNVVQVNASTHHLQHSGARARFGQHHRQWRLRIEHHRKCLHLRAASGRIQHANDGDIRMNSDEMIQRVERETRQLIGEQAIQIIILRAALEMAKPFPKGPVPPQPDLEDHPPMDWPKDKKWPPENMEDYVGHPRQGPSPQNDIVPDRPPPERPQAKAMNGKPRTING